MRPLRLLAAAVLLPLAASPVRASDDPSEDRILGSMLALVQQVVRAAAASPDPAAAQKSADAILAGENPGANRLAAGVLDDVLQDLPAEQRGAFVAIGRDLVALARRERARAAAAPAAEPAAARPLADPQQSAMAARRELHAMGLRYWDEQQFLDAVRRGDRIAVDLYLTARGLESRQGKD